MKEQKMIEKLEKLAKSYTPEWSFSRENPDAGSVLGILISDMLEDSKERLGMAMHKHKIQYLNRFDRLVEEPVSAARGYVQFLPVAGVEDVMLVPAGTAVSAQGEEKEIIFETTHDICLADAGLTSVLVTDQQEDRIVALAESRDGERLEKPEICAFDISGMNEAKHVFFLGLAPVLEGSENVELMLKFSAKEEKDAVRTARILASSQIQIMMAEPAGEEGEYREVAFDRVLAEENLLYLGKDNYNFRAMELNGKRACYLVFHSMDGVADVTVSGIECVTSGREVLPDTVSLEGVNIGTQMFAPFGVPLEMMSECAVDSREVFSKKGAQLTMEFDLDYEIREQKIEMAEPDVEYKAIMKKQPEIAQPKTVTVCADRIVWEYRSESGWKRLLTGGEYEKLMNGDKEGKMSISFICPSDMAEWEDGEPRIRVRLLSAENIYKMPAVYKCPVIRNLRFSYDYSVRPLQPVSAWTMNNCQERNCMERFEAGADVGIFYPTENAGRSMYFCFDNAISGLPFALYFDIDNRSGLPVKFSAEYFSANGFKSLRMIDGTDGFLHSGVIRFLIASDMKPATLYGRQGYFLRFTGLEKEYPAYRLPGIRAIYPNMARVANQNTRTEYFYVDDRNEPLTIKLSEENLTMMEVSVYEQKGEHAEWVVWKKAVRSYEAGRVYQEDLAAGTISFSSYAFSEIRFGEGEPQIRVSYRSYKGDLANVPAGTILTVLDANRYISEVVNPFAAYGGCDAYTEESTAGYIEGILKSRNRIVTEEDLLTLLRQTSYSVLETSCAADVDEQGNVCPGVMTVAVLTQDTDHSGNVFYDIRKEMLTKLEETGNFCVMGKKINLVQPRFLPCSVSVWLEKDSMEHAYELTRRAEELIIQFLNPYHGGSEGKGWKIGTYPRVSQIRAWLKKCLPDVTIARLSVTASVDGEEKTIKEEIRDLSISPFVMPVSGNHRVYVDLK